MYGSTAAASGAEAVMASLQRSRSATGDFTLSCKGQEIRAHHLVLSHGLVQPFASHPQVGLLQGRHGLGVDREG